MSAGAFPECSRKLLGRWQRQPGVIQPPGFHQPSCNLCCSAPVFSQAPPSCSSPGTEGVRAERCVVSQFMVVVSVQCSVPHPAAGTRPATAGMGAVFQCRLSLCKAVTRILSVSAINAAPFGSGVGLVTPLGYKKGLYVPSSPLSKSDSSLFTT